VETLGGDRACVENRRVVKGPRGEKEETPKKNICKALGLDKTQGKGWKERKLSEKGGAQNLIRHGTLEITG